MKVLIELEFNEEILGPKWMNPDNLDILLYTESSTKRSLLKVVSFKEESSNKKVATGVECNECEEYHMWNGINFCLKCGTDLRR